MTCFVGKELEGNDLQSWHQNESSVIHAIDVTLENAVVALLLQPLLEQARRTNAARDQQFVSAVACFRDCSQEDLHVPAQFVSPSKYAASCSKMKELALLELLPTEVLDVVLRTVGSIYEEAGQITRGIVATMCFFFSCL